MPENSPWTFDQHVENFYRDIIKLVAIPFEHNNDIV